MSSFWNEYTCPRCKQLVGHGMFHDCPEDKRSLGIPLKTAVVDHYAPLRRVLDLALEQARSGKGAQRHGQGQPFDKQPMMEIGRMIGGPAGCFHQAMKKTQEASRMEPDAAKREILGAINYLAGAYLLLDEKGGV